MKTDVTLSNQAIRPLMKAETSATNLEAIILYHSSGGEIELTEKQKELDNRWDYAADIIRANTGKLSRGEMANMIKVKFGVSLCTAKQDMVCAEHVHSCSNPLNKKFKISGMMDFLDKQIRLAAADNDHKAVEKYIGRQIELLAQYPEITPPTIAKTPVFILDMQELKDDLVSIEDAEFTVDEELKNSVGDE